MKRLVTSSRLLVTALGCVALALAPRVAHGQEALTKFSVEGFQTDFFTGAATLQIPGMVPLGAAGTAPRGALTYDSGTVDELGVCGQGQGTGLGWTLGPDGAVIRNTQDTATTTDDTFRLVFGGGAHDLVLVDAANNLYRTKDETFWLVQYNPTGDYWTLRTKDGTAHRFGFNPDSRAQALSTDGVTPITYRYQIDEATTTSGVSIRYAYTKETATLQATGRTYDRAIYPDTISWAYSSGAPVGPLRQVKFVLGPRQDYTDSSTPTQMAFFDTKRLDAIEMWVGPSLVRKYLFGYDYSIVQSTTCNWTGGATGALTLKSFTLVGNDGVSTQPAITFSYTDGRLSTVNTGLGGTSTVTYEHVATGRLATACERTDAGGACLDWGVTTTATGTTELGFPVFQGAFGDTRLLYKVCKRSDATGACLDWGVSTTSGTAIARLMVRNVVGTRPLYETCLTSDAAGACLDWGTSTTSGTLLGYMYVGGFDRYRVASRGATDGRGGSATATVIYRDLGLSPDGKEFRGHAVVRMIDPAGHYTDTWFKQDDVLKGRVAQTDARSSTNALFTQAINTYTSSNPFPGVTWVRQIRGDISTCDGTSPCRQMTHTYEFDTYGNQTWHHEWGDTVRHNQNDWLVDTTNWIHRIKGKVLYKVLPTGAWVGIRTQSLYYDNQAWGVLGARGLLTKEEVWLAGFRGNPGNPVVTRAYDVYGNQTSITDPRGCTITTTFEASQTYPATVTNCLGHTASVQYDARWGVKTSETDANSQTTTYAYDAFGRLTKVTGPLDGASTFGTVSYSYLNLGDPNTQAVLTQRTEQSGTSNVIWTQTHFDGLGRAYLTRRKGVTAEIIQEQTFDGRGLVVAASAPRTATEAAVWTQFTYDAIGRRTEALHADGTKITTAYAPGLVTVTDERGSVKRYSYDSYNRLVKIEEVDAAGTYVTTHAYEVDGSLLSTTNHAGHVTSLTYDQVGRKTQMVDPNTGTWTYSYDLAGNLVSQTDAKGQTLSFTYDQLGRPLTKTYPGGAQIQWTYDDPAVPFSKGRLTRVSDLAVVTTFLYDAIGRVTQTSRLLDGTTYTTSQTYDALNRVTSQTLPDGEVRTYTYNAAGWLSAIPNYVTGITYNSRGQQTQLQLANGVTTNWTYDPTSFWVTNQSTSGALGAFQNLTYTRDPRGNITQITDSLWTASRTFTYDALNRLTSASGTFGAPAVAGGLPTQVSQTYTFDAIGNLTEGAGVLYAYSDLAHPSAVTSTSNGFTLTYDANGNMDTGAGRAGTWDADNRLTATSIQGGNTASFAYDSTGRRVRKQTLAGVTRYPFGGYEIDPTGVVTKFVVLGTYRVAAKKSTGATLFYHTDHLGSVNVITDATGQKVQLVEYTPWGMVARAEGTVDEKYRFNGRELDDPELGLLYYGGRYYSAALARFLSPDPFVQDPANPQGLNRYSYVDNDPVNYTDPSGFRRRHHHHHHHGFFSRLFDSFVRALPAIIVGVAVGVVAVATGGFGLALTGPALAAVAGAAGGAAAGAVNTAVNGGNLLTNVLVGAALGAAGGVVGGQLAGALAKPLGAFGAAVASGAIVGGGLGGVTAAVTGGNILEGIAGGAITGAAVAAAVYGGFKAYEWAKTQAEATPGKMFALAGGSDATFVSEGSVDYGEHTVSDPILRERLDTFAEQTGRRVVITSGDRSPDLNAAVGGARSSYHLSGRAADFVIEGLTVNQAARMADVATMPDGSRMFPGVGNEDNHVHVDMRPGAPVRFIRNPATGATRVVPGF